MTMSGRTPCACRDCMDESSSNDMAQLDLCELCKEAGCEPYAPDSADYNALPGHMRGCQRKDAYGEIPSGTEQCEGCGWEARNCACGEA